MKHLFTLFLFVCLLHNTALSQTGTIKIAKPSKKDTVVKKQTRLLILPFGGANFTFKQNDMLGWSAGMIFSRNKYQSAYHYGGIGIQYSEQYQYFKLSPYNTKTQETDIAYYRSQNRSEYIKLMAAYRTNIIVGRNSSFSIDFELTPSYLIKNKNEHGRLDANDFNRFNLAGTVGLGMKFFWNTRLYVFYSKSFFNELKDQNLYDATGVKTGSQKTKTDLLTLSLRYSIQMIKKQ